MYPFVNENPWGNASFDKMPTDHRRKGGARHSETHPWTDLRVMILRHRASFFEMGQSMIYSEGPSYSVIEVPWIIAAPGVELLSPCTLVEHDEDLSWCFMNPRGQHEAPCP